MKIFSHEQSHKIKDLEDIKSMPHRPKIDLVLCGERSDDQPMKPKRGHYLGLPVVISSLKTIT